MENFRQGASSASEKSLSPKKKDKYNEQVLVFSTERLKPWFPLFAGSGLIRDRDSIAELMAMAAGGQLEKRGEVEDDEDYMQVIGYVLVRRGNEYLSYRRIKGEKGSDKRLAGKASLGFGGHAGKDELYGLTHSRTPDAFLMSLARRELTEELDFGTSEATLLPSILAAIHDRSDAVGRVHLGFVGVVTVPPNAVIKSREEGLVELEWVLATELTATLKEHNRDRWEWESWSEKIIRAFY